MRRFFVAAVIGVMAAGVAAGVAATGAVLAQDQDPSDPPARVAPRHRIGDALSRGETDEALEVVRELLDTPDTSRADLVDAARATADLFPHEIGNGPAVDLFLAALRKDRSDEDKGWTHAQKLRKRLTDELDVKAGKRLLEGLMELYPKPAAQISYRRDLAYLYLDAGRLERALDQFRTVAEQIPEKPVYRRHVAALLEQLGRPREALQEYESLIRDQGSADAFRFKAALEWRVLRDFAAAEKTFADGRTVIDRLEPGETKAEALGRLDFEKVNMEGEILRMRDLRALDGRIDRTLWIIAVAWAAVLGGGVVFLRRRGWL